MQKAARIPAFRAGSRPYRTCGYVGFVLAVLCAVPLVEHQDLSWWILCAITTTAVATFCALAMATRILTGVERLIYYHHEIAIVATVALCVRATGQPVLPYLDVTILAIGAFLVCGRIGCLLAGCCYGRPARWGVSYHSAQTHAGFPERLVGVTLFPIQAVEALFVLAVVARGVRLVLTGAPAGDALAWYVVMYGTARFFFEFLRGDGTRPYWGGFSEAQWTSLALMAAGVLAQWIGVLAVHRWHAAVTLAIVCAMVAVASWRRVQTRSALVAARTSDLFGQIRHEPFERFH